LLRIEALLTLLAKRSIQPLLEQELSEPIARKIYEATGDKTVREIAEETGVGIGTVSRTWARWETLGIVTKEGTRYRRVV
jgi:DNA-binding transcriptional regulator YhcF (GntR family)